MTHTSPRRSHPWRPLCTQLLVLTQLTLSGCDPDPPHQAQHDLQVGGGASGAELTKSALSHVGIERPSRQLLEASPKLIALQGLLDSSSTRTLKVGGDLARLAWAQALAEVGALQEATTLAEQLSQEESSSQLGALSLLIEIAPCNQGSEALKALKGQSAQHKLPAPWDEEHIALTERGWAQRCDPGLLRKVNKQISKRLPKLALKLSLALPKSLKASDQLTRALALEAGRAYPEALKLLDQLLKREGLPQDLTWRARYERARIQIERVRADYEGAARALDALAREPRPPSKKDWRDARLLAAKAWSKSGDSSRAERVYQELIKEWEHSDEAKTARFMIAFSHYEAGAWRKAVKAFAKLCRHQGEPKRAQKLKGLAGKSGWTRAAEWYHAWSLYQYAKRASAPFLLYQVGEGLPSSEGARKAAYWASKALKASKRAKEAKALREALIQGDPLDWYSLLLRAQYRDELSDQEPLKLSKARPRPQELSEPSHTDPLKRLLFAQRLGLSELIPLEQRRAQRALKSTLSALSQRERLELLSWARSAELIELSLRVSVGLNPSLTRALPSVDDALSWRLSYPWDFSEDVAQAAELEGLSETTILSFIRKESAFQARAKSPAHALGLMQLLEKTAFSIATWEGAEPLQGLDPGEINLLSPSVNIKLGARYLHALSERYHGQLPLIAASYNAGPANLNSWLKQSDSWRRGRRLKRNQVPLDLFIERVPFKEARLYVKRLLKTQCVYELLYGELSLNQCAATLPLTLDTSIKSGVQF